MITAPSVEDDLAPAARARLLAALRETSVDVLLVAGPENVAQVTGYRSLAETMRRDPTMVAALDREGGVHLVAPAADAGPVLFDGLVEPERFVPYGRFFFEAADAHPAALASGVHPALADALSALLQRIGASARIGVDGPAGALVPRSASRHPSVDLSLWLLDLRARKLPAEIARLERAARLTEAAIDRSLELIGHGATEADVARQVAGDLAAGGASPRFIVVTAGERSALSDAVATERPIGPGDLVRFDVGSVLDGYWADLGRTVVVGEPDAVQRQRYRAILAGEEAQLEAARPGVTGEELFRVAVEAVERSGLAPYRRHHCGHAIGAEVYERPIIAPGWDQPLAEGMTFCFETPFYDLGWGGVMVEDTVVITADGCRRLNASDRSLRVVG